MRAVWDLNLGGDTPRADTPSTAQALDLASKHPNTGETEVPDSREDLNTEGPATANAGSDVRLELSAEDAETLLKLREAGLIELDGLETGDHDPWLTEWTYDELLGHMTVV
jgi:hypothetical protein